MKQKRVIRQLRRAYKTLQQGADRVKAVCMLNSLACRQLEAAVVYEVSYANFVEGQLSAELWGSFGLKIAYYIAQAFIRGVMLHPELISIVDGKFTVSLHQFGSLELWQQFQEENGLALFQSFECDVLHRSFAEMAHFSDPADLLTQDFDADRLFDQSKTVLWHFQRCFPQARARALAWAMNSLSPIPVEFLIPLVEDGVLDDEKTLQEVRAFYRHAEFERDFQLVCGAAFDAVDCQQFDAVIQEHPQLGVALAAKPLLRDRLLQLFTVVDSFCFEKDKAGARLRAEDLIFGAEVTCGDLLDLLR